MKISENRKIIIFDSVKEWQAYRSFLEISGRTHTLTDTLINKFTENSLINDDPEAFEEFLNIYNHD